MSLRKKLILAILVLFLAALACDFLPSPEPDPPSSDAITTAVAATLAPSGGDPDPAPGDPTPEPAAPLKVAYVKDGDLWFWEDGAGSALQLTSSGDVVSVRLSDDGLIAAFIRQYSWSSEEIYAVNTDGTNLRALVTLADFSGMTTLEDAVSAVPSKYDWRPGTHTLAFNTRMTFEGPGLFLGDEHRLVDADTGTLNLLIPPGDGGDFYYSPDGSQIALTRADKISIVNADGTYRRDVLTFPIVITNSEYNYYPPVSWSPDSSFLRAAIPPEDPLAMTPDPTTIWHMPTDGSPASVLTTVPTGPIFQNAVRFSRDTTQIAYKVEVTSGPPSVLDLHLSNANGSGDVVYASGDIRFQGWTMDGSQFCFNESGFPPQLGTIGDPPLPIPGIASPGSIEWVDATRFLFLTKPGANWELWLRDIGGAGVLLDSTAGDQLRYDFVN